MSSSRNHVTNCPCVECCAKSRKCATKGCDRRRIGGSDFCLCCLTSRRGRPASRATCDNLPAIRDRNGI